jgi:hypothetical protein
MNSDVTSCGLPRKGLLRHFSFTDNGSSCVMGGAQIMQRKPAHSLLFRFKISAGPGALDVRSSWQLIHGQHAIGRDERIQLEVE